MTKDDVMEQGRLQGKLESLDNPIWFALTTEHRLLARSHGHARRYPPDVSPLAALLHPINDAFTDLRRLVNPGEHVALFTTSPLNVPGDWHVDRARWSLHRCRLLRLGQPTFPKCWRSPLPPTPA